MGFRWPLRLGAGEVLEEEGGGEWWGKCGPCRCTFTCRCVFKVREVVSAEERRVARAGKT